MHEPARDEMLDAEAAERPTAAHAWHKHGHGRRVPSRPGSPAGVSSGGAAFARANVAELESRRLGVYEVLHRIGVGGMGEVYLGRDTRIDRTVAIKVLTGEHAENAELRERFEREARAISRLNHPNICTLFDVGEHDGIHFLVMEYIEGETLARRLDRGALPLGEVLRIGGELAGALAAAHRRGIVHRDLKPANVMLTKKGVKLLDFGLAKLHAASHGLDPGQMPTEAGEVTRTGQVMGTFQYMSPEQAEGRDADARSDIFALGAVLYEMATGKRPFDGATRASVVAAVLRSDPPPIRGQVVAFPATLDHLILTCLAKDPDERWQSGADIALQLRRLQVSEGGEGQSRHRPIAREVAAWSLAAAALVAAVAAVVYRTPPDRPEMMRLRVVPPTDGVLDFFAASTNLALPPAGDRLAFVARVGGVPSLWVWSLADGTATRLESTDGAASPFWSPDGGQIAFFSQGKLRRVSTSGGPAITICDAQAGSSGSWGRGGDIVFNEWTGDHRGLHRVAAQGGAPTALVPQGAEVEEVPGWPEFLPDGRHLLFLSGSFRPEMEKRRVCVVDIGSGRTAVLAQADGRASYSSGHLLFVRRGALLAAPFSLTTFQLSGEPVQVAARLEAHSLTGMADYAAAAASQVLVFRDPFPASDLVWFDRGGRRLAALVTGQHLGGFFRLSPDETKLATELGDIAVAGRQLHVLDARTGMGSRLSFQLSDTACPVWAPDGEQLAFSSAMAGQGLDLYQRPLRGQQVSLLLGRTGSQLAQDWSMDGRFLAYEERSPSRAAQRQVWLLPLGATRAPYVLLDVPFSTSSPRFSPDSRFIAFVSEESGRAEVYVAPVADPSSKRRISPAGGTRPRWTRSGRELIYQTLDDLLMAVPVTLGPTIQSGVPDALFRVESFQTFNYEVTADGTRFLVNVVSDPMADRTVTVISSWPGAFAARSSRH